MCVQVQARRLLDGVQVQGADQRRHADPRELLRLRPLRRRRLGERYVMWCDVCMTHVMTLRRRRLGEGHMTWHDMA